MGSSVSVRIHAFPWNVPATIRGSADKESLHRIAAPLPQLAEASAASKLAAHHSTARADSVVGATLTRPQGARSPVWGATNACVRDTRPKGAPGRHKGVPYDGPVLCGISQGVIHDDERMALPFDVYRISP